MTIDYNVLNHLGINLYSNIAAVLSEAVANAYDADATEVSINIRNDEVIIADNGSGMNTVDINDKFLKIGYQKRHNKENAELLTPMYRRNPMGRKGLGKLSLMSIAKKIEIHTLKEGGTSEAFLIDVNEIENLINSKTQNPYFPSAITPNIGTIGTKIVLNEIRKNRTLIHPEKIRKELARRFSFLTDFEIKVNDKVLTLADREYFKSLTTIFEYGDCGIDFLSMCKVGIIVNKRPNEIYIEGSKFSIKGWIGYADKTDDLKINETNLNKISILARGKLGQEDILGDLHNTSMFTNYLIGEIEADFLDGNIDLATSSREGYQKETAEYNALYDFIKQEVSYIGKKWNETKEAEGIKNAIAIDPVIEEWYNGLIGDEKKMAKKVLGNINKTIFDESKRREMTKYGILAFEKMRYTKNLSSIDTLSIEAYPAIGKVLQNIDDVEASMYYQIVRTRMDVIKKFQDITDLAVKEKVIQEYLFEHLWLLDPAWERPTSNENTEKSFRKLFDINVTLTETEKAARLDICYKHFAGKFIIVELKRYDRIVSLGEIIDQVRKYHAAAEKCLLHEGMGQEHEIIVILGKTIKDCSTQKEFENAAKSLEPYKARIVYYDALIHDASEAYRSFFNEQTKLNPIIELFKKLEEN
jgi:hypothetical protein